MWDVYLTWLSSHNHVQSGSIKTRKAYSSGKENIYSMTLIVCYTCTEENIWLQCPVRTLDLNNRKASSAFDTDWYNMFNFNQYNIISISLPNPVLYENRWKGKKSDICLV